MPTTETIIGDPADFIVDREELPLDELGLKVVDADWGDSDHELFLVKQILGEIPADRHPPNRQVSIKLQAREKEGVSLAAALYKLQQKVGLWQQEGGWVLRRLDEGGKFKSAVGFQVRTAVLGGISGWLMAHRGIAPEITLVLTLGPYCYSTNEVESEEYKTASGQDLTWELTTVHGTAPGLIRIALKNEMAAGNNFRALLSGIESRDHPQDATKSTTAALSYEAEAMTLGAKAAKFALAGSSGGEVVRVTESTESWQTMLKSKVTAGNLTHVGARRIWERIYYEAKPGNDVFYRLRWRQVGSPYWTTNKYVAIRGSEARETGFYYIDLGEVRLETPILGNKEWEFQLQARKANTSEAVTFYSDKFFILPTEQFLALSNPPQVLSPDNWSTKSEAGTLSSGEAGVNTKWTTPENAKTSNNLYAEAKEIPALGRISEYLKLSNFGFALPEGATPTGIVVEIERSASVASSIRDYELLLVKAGAKQPGSRANSAFWPTGDAVQSYGGSEDQWDTAIPWTRADINNAGFGVWLSARNDGGAVATAKVDQIKVTVYYSELSDESAICFQSRSLQLRSDGCVRQHQSTENWGKVVPYSGFLPYSAPSGMEGRAMRGILAPATGDLETTKDSTGTKAYSARVFYRPAYHFTSEAE